MMSAQEDGDTMRIGFVGTGTMGTPIAGCLLHAGHALTIYDRRPEAMSALCAEGAVPAASAFEAARDAETAFTSLPGPAEFEAAMLESQTGILAGLPRGTVHIDLTTNAPNTIARMAEACRARGVELIDAPVSGRPPNMTVMVGGSEAGFARFRPLFDAIAANVFHVGPSGAGTVAKLVTQYLGYTNFIAAIEGMLIAARAGIDLDVLARIVPVSAGQSRSFDNIPRGVLSRSFAAGGTLDIVAKDVELACRLARGTRRAGFRSLPARSGTRLGSGRLPGRRPRARRDGRHGTAPGNPRGRQAMTSDRAAHLLLTQEIADFLYAEAELLDERRYDEWLELLADDIRYWMPMRRNVKYGDTTREFTREGEDISWFDEGKPTLTRRVRQIQTGIHWAEEPQSRITHMVSNVQLLDATPGVATVQEVSAKCRFLIYRNRVETETDLLVGKRMDTLRRAGDGWQIARRQIILDQNVLMTKNLTFFF
jgi:3-hydroxyisobutyrate dehydrogenase-like beta-hydroxyacid dehydrogenase/3-phenylpropionate/cinnamic acid dioxygenase small subunit